MAPAELAHLTSMLDGQCRTGCAFGFGGAAMTANLVTHVPTFPRLSATLKVISYSPGPRSVPGGGSCCTTPACPPPTVESGVRGQLSVEVTWERKSGTGALHGTAPVVPPNWPRFTVTGPGQLTTGGVVSPKKKQA